MGTCKTCEYWDSDDFDAYDQRSPESKAALAAEGELPSGYCCHPKLSPKDNWPGESLDSVTDHGGILTVGPDFGCVHHEERDGNA